MVGTPRTILTSSATNSTECASGKDCVTGYPLQLQNATGNLRGNQLTIYLRTTMKSILIISISVFVYNASLCQVSEAFDRGFAKLEQGNYAEALVDFNQVIKEIPTHGPSYMIRGFLRFELGDYQGAIDDTERSFLLGEELGDEPLLIVGSSKSELGDYAGALKALDVAIKINPSHAASLLQRGICKHELGDYFGAVKDFNQVIDMKFELSTSYSNRGSSKGKLEDHHGAIQDYNKSLEFDPSQAKTYYLRGNQKFSLDEYSDAIKDYDKAISISSQYADAYYFRGMAKHMLSSGSVNEACLDWSKAGELGQYDAYELITDYCK